MRGETQRNLPLKGAWHHIKNYHNQKKNNNISLGVSSLLINIFNDLKCYTKVLVHVESININGNVIG